jgi:hypothetical protein
VRRFHTIFGGRDVLEIDAPLVSINKRVWGDGQQQKKQLGTSYVSDSIAYSIDKSDQHSTRKSAIRTQ